MAEDRIIKIGVIGTGMIGKRHIERYGPIDGAEVVAVADLDEAEATKVAAQHGIADVYTDYRKMLERDDIEAIDVCLHNQLHRPMTVDALEAGKDVYCEKPIAAKYADGVAMVEAANRTGRKLHIQIGSIYKIEARAARAMVLDGLLGEVYHGRAWVNQRRARPFVDGYGTAAFVNKETAGGGALIDWGIYAISQVLYVMGNPKPERVSGATYNKLWMDEKRAAESGYDVEEIGLGFVRMEGGTTMDVMTAWALNLGKGLGCAVAGSKGGVQLPPINGPGDLVMKYYHTDRHYEFESELNTSSLARRWKNVEGQGDVYESSQHHWVRALQGRVDLLPTAEIALNMLLIAEGIYLSSELNHEVTADEILKASKEA